MKHVIRLLVALLVLGGLLATARAQEVFSPGNGVTLPVVTHEVKPDYTPEAKAARIQGTVLLDTVVLADGNVGDVKVARSLDTMYGLDEQAVNAAKQWTFKPGTKDGKPVPVRVSIELTFTLK
jgi:periplasmic protein TonB